MVFPVWLVALVVAGAAPLVVRLVVSELERRARERTEPVIAELSKLERRRHRQAPDA